MEIPIVDFSVYELVKTHVSDDQLEKLGKELKAAFTNVGFVYLKNTGIHQEEVDKVMSVSKKFFSLPENVKTPFSRGNFSCDVNHGWVSLETESLNPQRPGDLKEAFNITSLRTDINWPSEGVEDFQDVHVSFYLRCKDLSLRVLRVMALGLGLDADVFLKAHKQIEADVNPTTLRTLYYPPVKSEFAKQGQVRCGEHSDYGSITLVFQHLEGGLQVRSRTGEYISAPPIPETVLINIADLMQRWTSDVFVSAVHRVLLPPEGDSNTRQSLAFFVHPDNDAIITCCDGSNKYPPINSLDYLLSRFKDSYGKKADEKLSYHRRSRKCLRPGLYLGYLKLYTSVDQIRVLVSHKHPNVLCHIKIRDNGHVSREEWEWLQSLSSLEGSAQVGDDTQSAPHRLLLELRTAAKDLLSSINIPNNQAQDFRVHVKEVVELGEGVSFLLLLPPCEEVCSPPGQNHLSSLRSGFFTLPLQIFELVHFEAYCPSFIALYCRVSALLGLESLMSQQSLREAFSESELLAAKQKHQQIEEYLQHMDDLWRDARWMAVLQSARYKHQNSGASLGWIIDFSKEPIPEKSPSTSSQPGYLPSPAPSPDTTRKHNDSHGLSDEETSEVFFAAESDFNSGVPQSTRELDLLPSSPTSFRSTPSTHPSSSSSPRSSLSQPDVLRIGGGSVPGREHLATNSYDSDFILPSRQIELLRVTEKRTALCVRTSSLEYPPPVSTATTSPGFTSHKNWTRPSSFDLCLSAHEPRPVPVRTLSEDSGVQRLSSHSAVPGSPLRLCHTTLRVYPQYRTGLPKDTSVKLRVTTETSAKEMVRLVVQEINTICRHLQKAAHQCTEPCSYPACVSEVCVYGTEQLEHFGLVLLVEGREKWLQDDFCPLSLQNPWTRGKLCVRFKEYSPLALQFSRATPV